MTTTFYVRREGKTWIHCPNDDKDSDYKVFASDIPILGGCTLAELGNGKPSESLEATIPRWLIPIMSMHFGLIPEKVWIKINPVEKG